MQAIRDAREQQKNDNIQALIAQAIQIVLPFIYIMESKRKTLANSNKRCDNYTWIDMQGIETIGQKQSKDAEDWHNI